METLAQILIILCTILIIVPLIIFAITLLTLHRRIKKNGKLPQGAALDELIKVMKNRYSQREKTEKGSKVQNKEVDSKPKAEDAEFRTIK